MTQKQFKLVTRINTILLITNDMTQKQSKLVVTRINKILLITNDMTQKQFKLVTRINKILLIFTVSVSCHW
jgi:GTP cyclohydrolase III